MFRLVSFGFVSRVLNANLISKVAIKIIFQFWTTYLCEQSFPSLLLIISDPCLKDIDGELSVALSNIEPNVQGLCQLLKLVFQQLTFCNFI